MNKPDPANPRTLHWSGLSALGRRLENEDAFLGLRFNHQDIQLLGKTGAESTANADFVFAVSDGMGGHHAGEFASRVAVDRITKLMPQSFKQSALGMQTGFGDIFEELFDQIHRSLSFLASDPDCAGMGATLSLCWFTPGWMYFAHIGDSRIYYLPREGGLKQLTEDDTHVGWLFRKGEINEREARDHPRRKILQKALGAGHQFVDPQVGSVAYEKGDLFLLCTDGVIEGLFDDQLLNLLRSPDPAQSAKNHAQRIVDEAVQNSGRDNTTALVVEIV
ncbi:MAG TPA: protein phosphatase 2C domain-containing protein [Chthoniobacteraceae bacterium]|nr:protein phosphatase 2C domain-containing protein [Chthoniobacteraceae bacterium]